MKRQILISLLVLFSASGFAGADNLPLFGLADSLQYGTQVYKQDELIVRFANPETETRMATGPWSTRTIRSMISSSIVDGAAVEKVYDDVAPGLAVVKLPQGTNVMGALAQFNSSPDILYAEPNYKYKLFLVPNDPNYPDQWALDNTGQTGGLPDADIDANDAWDINTGSSDVIIAIADTGIDCYHFESQVAIDTAVAAAAGDHGGAKITLMGNINNPEILLRGTPVEVAAACHRAVDGGVQILSPDCAVPLTTPLRNLKTLVDVAEGQV